MRASSGMVFVMLKTVICNIFTCLFIIIIVIIIVSLSVCFCACV